MAENPYSDPTKELGGTPGFLKLFTRCLPSTAAAFIAILLCIAGIDLARSAEISSFITAPGFLGTLAALCAAVAFVLHAASLPRWARYLLAPVLAAGALFVVVILLNAVGR